MDWIDINAEDGSFSAYLAKPASGQGPVVVVIQEIFGVNDDVRATCHELAEQGFIAVAPDLFWREGARIELNKLDEEEWKKGFALYQSFDFDRGVRDIAAVVKAARTLEGASGKVGITGFCLGGLMTFLAAVRTDVDTAVSYYGGGTEQHVGEAAGVTKPVMLHLAGDDEYMPAEAQQAIVDALADKPNFQVFIYPGCQHAFARHKGVHYDKAAADLANGRTREFLKANLA